MNTTRKAFLNAGAIIAIVVAAVFTLLGIISIVIAPIVTADNLAEVYEKDTTSYKTYYVNDDKSQGYDHFVELNDRGEETATIVYYKDLKDLATLTRAVLNTMGWGVIILEVASFVMAILVMKNAKNNRMGFIITLLVLSAIGGNLITFAFMVVGLCLRNKLPPELESGITTTKTVS